MLSQVRLKWTHPWVCLAFLRFLKTQKALLYWMMMQSCLTADHLGMKCGFSPSIFKYWRLCFQQGWQTRSFYRTLFYEVLLNNPKFEGTKWGQAVEMAYGMGGASFGGPVLPSGWTFGFLCGQWLLPLLQGGFFLLLGVWVSSCPHATPEQLPLKRQSLVTCLVLEGSYWKRKPYFQGRGQL